MKVLYQDEHGEMHPLRRIVAYGTSYAFHFMPNGNVILAREN